MLGGVQSRSESIPWSGSIHTNQVLGGGKETRQTKQCSLHWKCVSSVPAGTFLAKLYIVRCMNHDTVNSSYDVMSTCWREQPEKRPSFTELVLTLTSLLEEIAAYMDFTVLTCLEQAVKYDHLYARAPSESQKGYDHLEPIQ